MLKVGQLIKFLADLNPQNTPTRLCFYNFLRGYGHPEQELTADLMEQFFNYCMDYPHWATNKTQLGHEIQFLLENFNSFYQQKFDLSKVRFPQHTQLIEIEHFADLVQAVEKYLKSVNSDEDKIRILSDQNKRAIAIVLKKEGHLEVRTFDKKFTIRNGQLEPLRKDLALFYTPELEIDSEKVQKIEVAPYITAQFTVKSQKVHGQLIRGYVFQKLAEFKNDPLEEQTRLLYPIKRLEQFFLDRRSDPFYQELTSQLERACSLVQQRHPEAAGRASAILNKAENALDNVFLGDKLLTLLIKDLRHASQNTAYLSKDSKSLTGDLIRSFPTEAKEECLKITPIIKYDLTN